tara:strand:+ start:1230 stop:2090 length:861 start_codon:yes stop_codon:yes gene_type:complete
MNSLRKLKQYLAKKIGYKKTFYSKLNLDDQFPCFAPRSGGDYHQRSKLTIESINNTIPALNLLIESLTENTKKIKKNLVKDIKEVLIDDSDISAGKSIAELLNINGSDKATKHDYFWVYGKILKERYEISKILEIGLGTNNTDVISNMGNDGTPGASLRAFKSFCPNAQIYGADIDKRILFEEERIKTFYLDQTKLDSFTELSKHIGNDFDLIIDDGLHEPLANIYTLTFALTHIRDNGWIVIEDIFPAALPVWENIGYIFKGSKFKTDIYRNKKNRLIFAINKIA